VCLDFVERVVEACSHNPPRAPTARTHPKPTRTYHIYQKSREKGRPSNHRLGALEQPLWNLLQTKGQTVAHWVCWEWGWGFISDSPTFYNCGRGRRFRGSTYILFSGDSQSSSSFFFPRQFFSHPDLYAHYFSCFIVE
jgi:hypothetical protein